MICCKGTAQPALEAMRALITALKLTVNEEKTPLCRVPEERLDLLGDTLGRCYSPQTGRTYIGTYPSKKSSQHLTQAISERTSRRGRWQDADTQVEPINRLLAGWANYYRLGPVSKAYRAVDAHAGHRLRQWLGNQHKQSGQG